MGPKILSSTGAGVWRKAPMAFPDSSSVLDKFSLRTVWNLAAIPEVPKRLRRKFPSDFRKTLLPNLLSDVL